MRSPARFVVVMAFLVLASPVLAEAAVGQWGKLSGDGTQWTSPASLALDGTNVVAAWYRAQPSGTDAEAVTFAPNVAPSARAPQRVVATGGWDSMLPPQLAARPGGGLQLLLSGIHTIQSGDPLNSTSFAPRNADGSFGAPVPTGIGVGATTSSVTSAVLAADGQTTLFVKNFGGAVSIYRGAVNPPAPTELGTGTDALPALPPVLRADAAGRVWAAWYALSSNPALVIAQIDPATGAPVGGLQRAPQSGTSDNYVVAIACASSCRLVYHQAAANGLATGRILSWAPGEPTPALVASAISARSGMAAAARPDGRVWTVWFDKTAAAYRAVLGDARGAGGKPLDLGAPPKAAGLGDPGEIAAIGAGNRLVVVAAWTQKLAAMWATVVDPSLNPAVPDLTGIDNPQVVRNGPALLVAPKRISLATIRKAKCVTVRVQSTTAARVGVAIFSGTRSVRVFGRAVVRFTAPGSKLVCVKVPLRAHTFDVRKSYRFAFAVQKGATPRKGEGAPREVSRVFRFLP